MHQEGLRTSRGFTLIETLIGLAVFAIISTGIFVGYRSVLDIIQSSQYNSSALSIIESQIELVRNMRYEDVGTEGGVPTGLLPQVQDIVVDEIPYELHTFVRNIDDPFDGVLGSEPNDTAPADYKLVEFQIICDVCPRYDLIRMSTYVAPKNLESSTKNGNLFVRVLDASGEPVAGATVHVTNPAAAINLTDSTNLNGELQLVDIATGSAAYHIEVSKPGYSSDQTYPPGNPPNTTQPDATVATQALTISSLRIDLVSELTVNVRDPFCAAPASLDFLMTGVRVIATEPDVPQYAQSHTIGASGQLILDQLAWDTYTLEATDTLMAIAGTATNLSMIVDPDTTHEMTWLVASRSPTVATIAVAAADGTPVDGATVRIAGGAYGRTRTTGQWSVTDTVWSEGSFTDRSEDVEIGGSITIASVDGQYASASQWLESRTIDLGTAGTTPQTLDWTATELSGTDVRFQIAANNDLATWNYVGPDGTAATYFTALGQGLPVVVANNRYLRYRATLETTDPDATPSVDDVTINFSSNCLVPGQAYFTELQNTSYTLTVTKPGFADFSGEIDLLEAWQRIEVTLQSP
ncbi:MAG TPA: carboxypeptidase regulatory-like domain-containing protein [Candidatus Paceibacterota bacterium]|nr:carboxypeptidase regulatory-like domain-containing protein [Candidatus Paceibacterota bacterium]